MKLCAVFIMALHIIHYWSSLTVLNFKGVIFMLCKNGNKIWSLAPPEWDVVKSQLRWKNIALLSDIYFISIHQRVLSPACSIQSAHKYAQLNSNQK
jgi:hypothetical protein